MTSIRISPQDLRYAGRLFTATADRYRSITSTFSGGMTGIAPSIAGHVSSEMSDIGARLRSIAMEVEGQGHALILIATFIEQAEAEGYERSLPDDFMSSLFTSTAALGRYAELTGLSRAAAVSQMMANPSKVDEFLASLPDTAKSVGRLSALFDFYILLRETGDPIEAASRTAAAWAGGWAGGAAAGYTCGVVFGWTGFGLFACIGAGMVGGAYVADKAMEGLFNPTYLGSNEWRLAKAETASGLLPIEEKLRDMNAALGLEEARALLALEYVEAGLSPEEARARAEQSLPDYSDAQLSP